MVPSSRVLLPADCLVLLFSRHSSFKYHGPQRAIVRSPLRLNVTDQIHIVKWLGDSAPK